MSRLRRIEERDRFFFVTTNLAHGVAHLSAEERNHLLRILGGVRSVRGFFLFGFVVMPAHVHLLLEPGTNSLVDILRDFKSQFALELVRARRTPGPIWQSRYFDFICRRVRDFWEKMEYVHQNPVEARLTKRAEDWPWSSAAWWARTKSTPLLLPDPIDLPANGDALLWPAPWR